MHAAHILVAYKGAMRADDKIVRTKDEAKKLAEQYAKRAAKEKFDDLAKKYSDDKSSAVKGGDLGEFAPSQMTPSFATATAALKPNTISGAVESPFGFHVIKRLP
jgi:parvulin-like peptidyl-prolyl isomerase